jgi:DNA-binding CsgD family transcriptional regulator
VTAEDRASPRNVLARFGVPLEAEALWRALIATPKARPDELSRRLGLRPGELEAAKIALFDSRLVQQSSAPSGVAAIDPSVTLESHVVRAERELVDGLGELAALRATVPALANEYMRATATDGGQAGVEIIVDVSDVRRQIYLASEAVKSDSRSLYYSSTVGGLADADPWVIDMMQRGVRCRSIIGPHELGDPGLYAGLEAWHSRGEQLRALPDIPTRLLIFDNDLAVLAVDPTDMYRGALFVRVRTLISLLVLLFDHMWSVAEPVFTTATSAAAPSGRRARTLELMAIGTKDERIARTLGVGVRTVRRDVADLKATLGVASRAEIVAVAIRKGWL